MRWLLLIVVLVALQAQVIAQADGICKSVDAVGVTSFAACTGEPQEQQINVKTSPAKQNEQPAAPATEQNILDVMSEDREKRKQARDQIKQQAAELKRDCVNAKDKLRSYKAAPFLYQLDKEGNRVPMPEQDQQQAIADLEAQITENCR